MREIDRIIPHQPTKQHFSAGFLEPLTPKALAAAEKILDDYLSENRDTPSARAIIELIFGYDFGKPILRHQRQEASHITVQFVNRSDEEEDAGK